MKICELQERDAFVFSKFWVDGEAKEI
jgi:hypothetical protein